MTDPRPRVLYIDDDDGLRLLVKRGLGRHGFDIVAAASGAEGVEKARQEAFDIIAVDHYMPGHDGLATLKLLRDLPDRPPIIYVTGSEESRIAVAALKAGAADYVVKTVGEDFFALLASACRQALDQVQLTEARRFAEQALQASNARLEALLREVNHRVANSLQLVSAFVQMQSSASKNAEAREALLDTQRRIQAIGQVHRRLYTSDNVQTVAMDEYLAGLVEELQETWSTPVSPRKLVLTAEPIALDTDKAVSVGVIVNELVSNACKYAYTANAAGEVRISLRGDGDHFVMCVEDDGCGLSNDNSPRGTGLGAKLIGAMVGSLKADLDYDAAHAGVRAILRAER
jgi:two-component sensor histidine kinase